MTLRNAELPTRAEVLEHGPALLPDWLEMHVPTQSQIDFVHLVQRIPNDLTGASVNFKHRYLRNIWNLHEAKPLTSTDWQGMVREAIGILEGER